MTTPRKKTSKARKNDEDEGSATNSLRPDEMPPEVVEFITAIDDYKRQHRRPFPNWSEVFQVVKDLGYVRPRA